MGVALVLPLTENHRKMTHLKRMGGSIFMLWHDKQMGKGTVKDVL